MSSKINEIFETTESGDVDEVDGDHSDAGDDNDAQMYPADTNHDAMTA